MFEYMQEYEVVICGAGISGLSTGASLVRKGLDPKKLLIVESSNRCGGNVESRTIEGNLLEVGPNSLMLKSQRVLNFIKDLEMISEIVTPKVGSKKRFLRRENDIWQITPQAILGRLNAHSRLRLAALTFSSARPEGTNESVYDFFCRKIGAQLTNELVVPFVSGIYAGDCRQLLVKQAFPNLCRLEARYNSIPLGLLFEALTPDNVQKEFRGLISFRGGLQTLTDRMVEICSESILLKSRVKAIYRKKLHGFEVEIEEGSVGAKNVVICLPAPIAAGVFQRHEYKSLREQLKLINYPSLRVFHFLTSYSDAEFKARGFGFLSQQYEKSKILGCLWPASCFNERCHPDNEIHTIFSGGQLYPDLVNLDMLSHSKVVAEELKKVLRMEAEPDLLFKSQWKHAIPQYDIAQAALERYLRVIKYHQIGLYFNCNYVGGVSLGDCITKGLDTAETISGVQ